MYMSTVYLDFQLAHVFLFMVTVAMIHALSDSLFSLERFDGSRAFYGYLHLLHLFFPGIYARFQGQDAGDFGLKLHKVYIIQKWCNCTQMSI